MALLVSSMSSRRASGRHIGWLHPSFSGRWGSTQPVTKLGNGSSGLDAAAGCSWLDAIVGDLMVSDHGCFALFCYMEHLVWKCLEIRISKLSPLMEFLSLKPPKKSGDWWEFFAWFSHEEIEIGQSPGRSWAPGFFCIFRMLFGRIRRRITWSWSELEAYWGNGGTRVPA